MHARELVEEGLRDAQLERLAAARDVRRGEGVAELGDHRQLAGRDVLKEVDALLRQVAAEPAHVEVDRARDGDDGAALAQRQVPVPRPEGAQRRAARAAGGEVVLSPAHPVRELPPADHDALRVARRAARPFDEEARVEHRGVGGREHDVREGRRVVEGEAVGADHGHAAHAPVARLGQLGVAEHRVARQPLELRGADLLELGEHAREARAHREAEVARERLARRVEHDADGALHGRRAPGCGRSDHLANVPRRADQLRIGPRGGAVADRHPIWAASPDAEDLIRYAREVVAAHRGHHGLPVNLGGAERRLTHVPPAAANHGFMALGHDVEQRPIKMRQ